MYYIFLCVFVIAVAVPTDGPHCDEPVKMECGFGQILKLETVATRCPTFVCREFNNYIITHTIVHIVTTMRNYTLHYAYLLPMNVPTVKPIRIYIRFTNKKFYFVVPRSPKIKIG